MKFIELFAGIGGFRYGLESINRNPDRTIQKNPQGEYEKRPGLQSQKGQGVNGPDRQSDEWPDSNPDSRKFTCVWSNEWDRYAAQIYRKNFGKGELIEGDITTINAREIPDHDLLVGGFPCQAFSIAGKRKGFKDTRGTLFYDIERILDTKRPRMLLLENVKGLLSHDNGDTFRTILWVLTELGYDLGWQVLNSKDFGVPQNRERVFIIGYLRGTSRPEVFPIRISEKETNKMEIIVKGHLNNYLQSNVIYDPEGLSPTLSTMQGRGTKPLVKLNEIRRLTPIECERLQGFPDNWTKGLSDSQRYKCLGNAVTTNVITEIGKRLV